MGVEVPKRKSLIEPLIATAAVLGIIQGLVWFVLSLVCILFYEGTILPTENVVNGNIGITIFYGYLRKGNENQGSIIIGAKEFNYFMYCYILLSFSLLVISSIILWAFVTEKSAKYHKVRICSWTINMTVLSLLDIILMSLLAHDYDQMKKIIPTPNADETVTLVSVGIVITLAARGYVVWIINVIFVVIFGKHFVNLRRKETKPDPSILDAYTTGSRPLWDIYADTNSRSGNNNKGYSDDNDNPMIISSSQSFTHFPINDRATNYGNRERDNQKEQNPYSDPFYSRNNNNSNWNKRNQNDNGPYGVGSSNSPLRPIGHSNSTPDLLNQWGQPTPLKTAKIGRQGGQRSPPLNVNSPYIPDPDYSPPGSPRVKGVLRPKSNYAMY